MLKAQAMEGGSSGTRHMRSQVGFVKVGGEGIGLGDGWNSNGRNLLTSIKSSLNCFDFTV